MIDVIPGEYDANAFEVHAVAASFYFEAVQVFFMTGFPGQVDDCILFMPFKLFQGNRQRRFPCTHLGIE